MGIRQPCLGLFSRTPWPHAGLFCCHPSPLSGFAQGRRQDRSHWLFAWILLPPSGGLCHRLQNFFGMLRNFVLHGLFIFKNWIKKVIFNVKTQNATFDFLPYKSNKFLKFWGILLRGCHALLNFLKIIMCRKTIVVGANAGIQQKGKSAITTTPCVPFSMDNFLEMTAVIATFMMSKRPTIFQM